MLEKTLENHLDSKEIKPVNPKGNQFWIFIRRTDAEAKAPILGHLIEKSWLIGKGPDPWKDWRQEEKGMTEDDMVRCHHRLNGHEFAQTPRNSEGQGSLVCCSPWSLKESDMTEWLNWTWASSLFFTAIVGIEIQLSRDCIKWDNLSFMRRIFIFPELLEKTRMVPCG